MRTPGSLAGSNGWLVAPGKSRERRAILANDMHLELRVPNVWYRAEIHANGLRLSGITLPGVPVLVSGSNRHVAWGFTNTAGDFLDFVLLDVEPEDPEFYRTPSGSIRFGKRLETVHVKGQPDVTLKVRDTVWGPVLSEPLLGKPVAVHWTALDPTATDLDLLRLGDAENVIEALSILERSGGPPLNALVADTLGNIGWTYVGRIPARKGMDGAVSRSWADGARGWSGYVLASDKPRVLNPPQGYLVNANQRMVGREYPYRIGRDFANGYRAFRISERLAAMDRIREKDLLELQLDTRSDFYRYYQNLALAVIDARPGGGTDAESSELRRYLEAWDGQAEPGSFGLPVLVEFRRILAEAVFSPFLARCRRIDPDFQYEWRNMDEPLRTLLDSRAAELQPEKSAYPNWNAFLSAKLQGAVDAALAACGTRALDELTWGCTHRTRIAHPFSRALPWLRGLLDMPVKAIPGCVHCVRMASLEGGASERLVVAPGHEEDAIFHMPAGQSGHPLSAHYRDQQKNWVEGIASPLLAGETEHRIRFRPGPASIGE